VIGLAAPGAKTAPGPHTPSITEQHGVAGPAGEQSRPASEIDDHPGSVEHNAADVTDERRRKHVTRINLMPVGGFAATLIDGRRVQRFRITTQQVAR
jgi:hypothetical protein